MVRNWISATRPKTLPAALVPIMVGAAEAYRQGFFDGWPIAVCLVFALLVQIATNMANDFFDYERGADTAERVGPERLVASGKIKPRAMLMASVGIFAVAFLVGLNLVAYRGWELLAVGVLSIVFGYGYTGGPYPLAYRGLGDVFVVIFFGLVATGGTFYVIAGRLDAALIPLGLALGLLANNILVVNNYRDLETDAVAGKRTLIVRWGRVFGRRQYWTQLLVAFSALALYAVWSSNLWAMLSLAALPIGVVFALALGKTEGRALNGLLARSAGLVLVVGLLTTAGIVLGARE